MRTQWYFLLRLNMGSPLLELILDVESLCLLPLTHLSSINTPPGVRCCSARLLRVIRTVTATINNSDP